MASMREQLEAGRLSVAAFLDQARTLYVDDAEIAALDPQGLSFFNVNTPDDLAEAERIVAGKDGPHPLPPLHGVP
jgi:molybdopterin-guanine dinucleotide biosynthesis protein A